MLRVGWSDDDRIPSNMSPECLKQLKLSHYTPRRDVGEEAVYLLFILDLGVIVSIMPSRA
jgi:hypothetical protein